jgi:hypothetical protein
LKNSVGEVSVEGWERPDVEITTVKSIYTSRNREKTSRDLDKVRISVERHGDELVITTNFPRLRRGNTNLEYRIKAPMTARLAADHGTGEVHVDNVTSDIHVTVLNGGMTLRLPQDGQYSIDARSDVGDVISDFPGQKRRRPWLLGHQFVEGMSAPHKLYLRVGFGDITILKIRQPSTPGAP